MGEKDLLDALLGALDLETAALVADPRGLAVALDRLVEASRAIWPSFEIPDRVFVSHLALHLQGCDDLDRALATIRGPDLYLACACAVGNTAAILAFEKDFLCEVPSILARMRLGDATVDEVTQIVRQRLLIGIEGKAPKIHDYAGRGPLETWVRVVVTRAAISLMRKPAAERPSEDEALLRMHAPSSDPELDAIRSRHLGDFKEAFQTALSSLSSRDRTLLKLHFVDGLSLDEIGGLHRVHRATVARWIARCREVVLEETRLRLAAKLRLTPAEMNSFLGLMRSSLDVSIQRLLERK